MFKIITILTLFYALTYSAVPEPENVGLDLNDYQQPLPLQLAESDLNNHQRDERHVKPCSRRKTEKEAEADDSEQETVVFTAPLFEPYLVRRLDESLLSLNNENNPAESTRQDSVDDSDDEALAKSHPDHSHVNARVQLSEVRDDTTIDPRDRSHQENQDSNEQRSSRPNHNNENSNRQSQANAEDESGNQSAESANNQRNKPGSSESVEQDQSNEDSADQASEKSSQGKTKGCRSHTNGAGTRRLGGASGAENTNNANEPASSVNVDVLNSPSQRSDNDDSQTGQDEKAASGNFNNFYNSPNLQQYQNPANRLNNKLLGYFGNQLGDPAQGAGVSALTSAGVNLNSHSRLCYACSSASNPTCLSPSRLTTVKYCRVGHDSCVTKTVKQGKNPAIVIRDCGKTCDDTEVMGPQAKSCRICDTDLCNKEPVNGAFSINNQSLMFTVFVIFAVKYAL